MDSGWRRNKYGGLFNVNEYMNDMIRKKVTMKEYVKKKEQEQKLLLQEFGYLPKEEKFGDKAQRLLKEYNKRKK